MLWRMSSAGTAAFLVNDLKEGLAKLIMQTCTRYGSSLQASMSMWSSYLRLEMQKTATSCGCGFTWRRRMESSGSYGTGVVMILISPKIPVHALTDRCPHTRITFLPNVLLEYDR